jgi:hypothetical protein
MTTYTEWLLVKQADEKSEYEKVQQELNAGNEETVKAMGTPAPQEFMWHLLGAGLGAGGGYLLSKKLRRNGTKRQRALDMIVGALLGGLGTNIALNAIPGAGGFSIKDQKRADNLIEARKQTNPRGNDYKEEKKPSKFAPNPVNVVAAAATAPIGMYAGHNYGFVQDMTRNMAFNKAMAEARAKALTFGPEGSKAFNDYLAQRAVQRDISDRAALGFKRGQGFDTLAGGAVTGTAGYILGSMANEKFHNWLDDSKK